MQSYKGKSVFDGIAIGRIYRYQKDKPSAENAGGKDAKEELTRYHRAVQLADAQLKELYDKTLGQQGQSEAAILEGHRLILSDDGYRESVERIITGEKSSAEYAVTQTAEQYSRMFSAMEDAYFKERAADIQDVSERLLAALRGKEHGVRLTEPAIVVADDLTPSETVQLDKDKVLAFVTVHGSLHSHTAILAKTMGIPALIGTRLSLDAVTDGGSGIVDSRNGVFYVEPDADTIARLTQEKQQEQQLKEQLAAYKDKESITQDGQKICLYANIGNETDIETVLRNGADGVGLFRSEFIYLEREDYPTEEEQFKIYRRVVEAMDGRQTVIRTLDIGADKQCGYFGLEEEENPALGCRAIRVCFRQPEVFRTQLRALLRAAAYGKLAIMYPMITSVGEIRRIKETVEEVKRELTAEEAVFGEVEQGIMIETPAAAVLSDLLAREVDFFSIGTNDLTQYTLAVDRHSASMEEYYDYHHPAVLRLVRLVVDNAHQAGIRVGICGELGCDLGLTQEFLAMGVDALSVSPGKILPLRRLVRETDVTLYRQKKR